MPISRRPDGRARSASLEASSSTRADDVDQQYPASAHGQPIIVPSQEHRAWPDYLSICAKACRRRKLYGGNGQIEHALHSKVIICHTRSNIAAGVTMTTSR